MVQSLIPFVARVGRRLAEHKRDLTVLDRRASGNDDDLARLVDLDAGDVHTSRSDCLDRSGHVLLPECGRRASHELYRGASLSVAIDASLRIVPGRLATRMKPDAVRPSLPVPVARGSEQTAMVTPMIG